MVQSISIGGEQELLPEWHGVSARYRNAFRCKGENMKAILMRSFNPAEIVEVMKIDSEIIEKAKRKDIELSKTLNDEVDVKQTLTYKDGLILHEDLKQKTKQFEAVQTIDVFLKEGDVLIHTPVGYQKNVMPIKFITDKEERLIAKFNVIGK